MTVSGVILIITVWQFVVIPKGFLPPEDRSQVFISTEAQQGISFDSMRAHQLELNKIALADPNVRDFFSGVGDFSSSNSGIIFLHLKDRPDRPLIPNPTIQAWQ
jgi:HAE1 family hydrophobic/amphiphilic exporter-1